MLDLTGVFRNFEDQDDAIQMELEELQDLKVHTWRTKTRGFTARRIYRMYEMDGRHDLVILICGWSPGVAYDRGRDYGAHWSLLKAAAMVEFRAKNYWVLREGVASHRFTFATCTWVSFVLLVVWFACCWLVVLLVVLFCLCLVFCVLFLLLLPTPSATLAYPLQEDLCR